MADGLSQGECSIANLDSLLSGVEAMCAALITWGGCRILYVASSFCELTNIFLASRPWNLAHLRLPESSRKASALQASQRGPYSRPRSAASAVTHTLNSHRVVGTCVWWVVATEARWHGVARGGVRVRREDETFVPVVFGSPSPNTRFYSSVSTVALRGGGRSAACLYCRSAALSRGWVAVFC